MCLKQLNIYGYCCVSCTISAQSRHFYEETRPIPPEWVMCSKNESGVHRGFERLLFTTHFLGGHISMSGCFQLLGNITEAKAIKPHMDLLFASPFRPINDAIYELPTVIRHTKPTE